MKPDNESDNRSTVSGPSRPEGAPANEFTAKLAATQELTAAMPYNANKALEYGEVSAAPEKGQAAEPPDPANRQHPDRRHRFRQDRRGGAATGLQCRQ